MKKLHNAQIISKLVVATPLTTITLFMCSFIANFVKILGICKTFAGNRVNKLGNIPRRGVVPKFSDIEVVALSIIAEAFNFDGAIRLWLIIGVLITKQYRIGTKSKE